MKEDNWVYILNSKNEDNKNIIDISGLTEQQRDLIGDYLVSLKNTNQLSEDEENREDSFEECESYSNDARPSLNPRFDYSFE